ncbi:MAG: CBS domain-containing protein [Burkholderiaceae bacterium]
MKNQPISALMQPHADVIAMDMSVSEVEAFLTAHRRSWAPVVADHGEVIGVLSDADLVRLRASGRDPDRKKAWQVSTYRPLCVDPQTTIGEVAKAMVERRIHHVVVTEDGYIRGVVSALDFVKTFV